MKYSQNLLDQIREKVILSDFVSERLSLRKQGQYHIGLCPFHTEKTPSFTVTNDKGMYFCFGCGEKGSVFDFLMKTKGLGFKEAVEEAAARVGVILPRFQDPLQEKIEHENLKIYEALEKASEWFKFQLQNVSGKEGKAYLDVRGVSNASQERFKLGLALPSSQGLLRNLEEKGISQETLESAGLILRPIEGQRSPSRESWDRFRGRIMFPIQDKKGRVIAFGGRTLAKMVTKDVPKYLNSPETSVFHKGKTLYGIWEVMKNKDVLKEKPLIFVEGYLDVILCWQEGLAAVAPLGTALTEHQLSEAWRFCSTPILCFDGDIAGKKAAFKALEKALEILRPEVSLKFAHLPKGEDPASLITLGQGEVLRMHLQKAQTLGDFLWSALKEQRRIDTPEHQALFKKNLFSLVARIKDKDVQEAYRHDMMMRFQNLFRERFPKHQKNSKIDRRSIPLLSSFETKRRQHKLLIAAVIQYPILLNEVAETFSTLDLEEPYLMKLRDDILDYYEKNLSLEFSDLEHYLKEKGCLESFLHFKEDPLFSTASFLREGTPFSEVKRGWQEVWILAQGRTVLKSEEKKLWEAFEATMSPNIWAEIQALNLEKESQKAFIEKALEEETE